jgi:hypothetical protein
VYSVRVQEAKSVTCVCGTHVHTVVPGTHHIIHNTHTFEGTDRYLQVKKYKIYTMVPAVHVYYYNIFLLLEYWSPILKDHIYG